MKNKNQSKTQDVDVTYTSNFSEYEIVKGYTPNQVIELPVRPTTRTTVVKDNKSKMLLYDDHIRMIYDYLVTYDREMEFESKEEEETYLIINKSLPMERVTEQVDEDFLTHFSNIISIKMEFENNLYRVVLEHNSPIATVANFKDRDSCEKLFNTLIKWKVKADLNKNLG